MYCAEDGVALYHSGVCHVAGIYRSPPHSVPAPSCSHPKIPTPIAFTRQLAAAAYSAGYAMRSCSQMRATECSENIWQSWAVQLTFLLAAIACAAAGATDPTADPAPSDTFLPPCQQHTCPSYQLISCEPSDVLLCPWEGRCRAAVLQVIVEQIPLSASQLSIPPQQVRQRPRASASPPPLQNLQSTCSAASSATP